MNVRHLRPEHLRGLRWRGYVRESTAAQADKWSPERQRSDIERAAGELGLVPAEPSWYERTGTGEESSVELQRALDDARSGQYDVLVVLTTSRFARNRAEAVRMKALYRKAGVPIYFAAERIVSGSRASNLLEGVREVIDEEENEVRRMWIAGGQRERMLAGKWVGAIPYGYRRVMRDFPDGSRRWDGAIEPDDRAPIVRRIFGQAAEGLGPTTIAADLVAEGIPGPDSPWTRQSVARLLANPVYQGDLIRYRAARPNVHYYPEADPHDGKRTVDAPEVASLLPREAWLAAQAAPVRHRDYPLSRKLRCPECGRGMTGVSNGHTRYYRCRSRARDYTCSAPMIRADLAEARN